MIIMMHNVYSAFSQRPQGTLQNPKITNTGKPKVYKENNRILTVLENIMQEIDIHLVNGSQLAKMKKSIPDMSLP